MNILFFKWNSVVESGMEQALRKQHNVISVKKQLSNYYFDQELSMQLLTCAHQNQIEAFFSVDYIPLLSSICETLSIPYYSWIYDCPHYTLYSEQAKLSCNHIYVFDRLLAEDLLSRNIPVSHLPLATEWNLGPFSNGSDYQTDLSFIGSFYDRYRSDFIKEEQSIYPVIDELLANTLFHYGDEYLSYLQTLIKDEDIKAFFTLIQQERKLFLPSIPALQTSDLVLPFLEERLTHLERITLLEALSNNQSGWKLQIYTGSNPAPYSAALQACTLGYADYRTQMSAIFHHSKINLNLTLRSIHSGVPQRIFDIMGCGGFVLTNYQPELSELFIVGKELVTFNSLEDCLSKIDYYLTHEEERQEIAANGYQKIKEKFRYDHALSVML